MHTRQKPVFVVAKNRFAARAVVSTYWGATAKDAGRVVAITSGSELRILLSRYRKRAMPFDQPLWLAPKEWLPAQKELTVIVATAGDSGVPMHNYTEHPGSMASQYWLNGTAQVPTAIYLIGHRQHVMKTVRTRWRMPAQFEKRCRLVFSQSDLPILAPNPPGNRLWVFRDFDAKDQFDLEKENGFVPATTSEDQRYLNRLAINRARSWINRVAEIAVGRGFIVADYKEHPAYHEPRPI